MLKALYDLGGGYDIAEEVEEGFEEIGSFVLRVDGQKIETLSVMTFGAKNARALVSKARKVAKAHATRVARTEGPTDGGRTA